MKTNDTFNLASNALESKLKIDNKTTTKNTAKNRSIRFKGLKPTEASNFLRRRLLKIK